MLVTMNKSKRREERGMAVLLALFALLLLSAIGLLMVTASTTETHIDANYGSSLKAYYAARSGLEEVRDRVKYPSSASGLASGSRPTGSSARRVVSLPIIFAAVRSRPRSTRRCCRTLASCSRGGSIRRRTSTC